MKLLYFLSLIVATVKCEVRCMPNKFTATVNYLDSQEFGKEAAADFTLKRFKMARTPVTDFYITGQDPKHYIAWRGTDDCISDSLFLDFALSSQCIPDIAKTVANPDGYKDVETFQFTIGKTEITITVPGNCTGHTCIPKRIVVKRPDYPPMNGGLQITTWEDVQIGQHDKDLDRKFNC